MKFTDILMYLLKNGLIISLPLSTLIIVVGFNNFFKKRNIKSKFFTSDLSQYRRKTDVLPINL